MTGALTAYTLDDNLAPDGSEFARNLGTSISVTEVATGAQTTITPRPALAGIRDLGWSRDGRFYVLSREGPVDALIELSRDGSWRNLVETHAYDLIFPNPSPGGRDVAVVAASRGLTWTMLPLVVQGSPATM